MYDFAMTAMMICIDYKALSNLVILNTLIVLSILSVLKAFISIYPSALYITAIISFSNIERPTTPPSSQFILSAIYLLTPIANNLLASSNIKIQVNHSFNIFNISDYSGSNSLLSSARTTVFKRTANVMNPSQKGESTKSLKIDLHLLYHPKKPYGQTLIELRVCTTSNDFQLFKPS